MDELQRALRNWVCGMYPTFVEMFSSMTNSPRHGWRLCNATSKAALSALPLGVRIPSGARWNNGHGIPPSPSHNIIVTSDNGNAVDALSIYDGVSSTLLVPRLWATFRLTCFTSIPLFNEPLIYFVIDGWWWSLLVDVGEVSLVGQCTATMGQRLYLLG
ncbi:hypothetical protein An02g02090 [Aspergillus niger]|uniref:Uncharacterized protein n=2 Tax=Aspergillus niger TaxID=5061 RepID=A2QC30_ASPNC|nr:hypothetical protein An02g02090 [Aspergillus niger]CAK37511.1 hypothetical protein An02g02090 [Aspergillus niger]